MNIYTVTLEDNEALQCALEICWQYSYATVDLAKAAVLKDVHAFRKSDGVGRGAPVEWLRNLGEPQSWLLEDNGRTWNVFTTELIGS